MIDTELKMLLSQMIDNQQIIINKLQTLIELNSNLTNTIIKYDNEYQQQIVNEAQKLL
jgi:hypothetical protein